MRTLRLALIFALVAVANVLAHDPGISTAQGELRNDRVLLTTGFSPADVQQLLPAPLRTDSLWGPAEFDAAHDALLSLALRLWEVRADDALLAPREVKVELLPGDSVSFSFVVLRPPEAHRLTLHAPEITHLPSGHRQFVIISDERGSTLSKKLLSARDSTIEVMLQTGPLIPGSMEKPAPNQSDAVTFWGFVRLGVEHIWTGYDHLLFLLALLVVCRTFRSIVTVVSCFTLAHSITLALATLDWVNVPSRFVEPAIAASIVFVGLENLFRRGAEPKRRWAVTFGFGLLHGFGFASVLRDLGVGRTSEGILVPLLTFNLGVEVGQVVVAALVLPIIWQLRKKEEFVRRGVPVLSALIAAAGLYWFMQRTIFA